MDLPSFAWVLIASSRQSWILDEEKVRHDLVSFYIAVL